MGARTADTKKLGELPEIGRAAEVTWHLRGKRFELGLPKKFG